MAAGLIALLAGCGSSPDTAETQAPGNGPSRPAASPSAQDGAVVAYLAMWDDTVAAARTSDVDHPRLDDHAEGDALALLKFVMQGHAEEGQVARGAPRHDVEVVESETDRRELRDCMDDREWLMYDRGGELVNDTPGSRGLVDATVERQRRQWVVTDLVMHGAATC